MFHFKKYQVFLILNILNYISGAQITDDFKSIFVGRCNSYKLIDSNERLQRIFKDEKYKCENLLNSFQKPLKSVTNGCSMKPANYDEFVRETYHEPEGNMIFWSGTESFSKEYVHNGKYGYSMRTSLAGYILHNLECSHFGSECEECGLVNSLWKQLSIQFAKNAVDEVTVLLNATKSDEAYSNSSVFRSHEVPNLNYEKKVTKLTAILVRDIGVPAKSTCKEDRSLKELQNELAVKNIKFECQQNPDHVRHLLCSRIRSRSSECDFAYANSPQSPQIHSILISMSTLILSSIYFF